MRLKQEEVRENRRKIIDTAGRLFRKRGFDGVGVAELMAAAGFTHGGFYNHFPSKEALATEDAPPSGATSASTSRRGTATTRMRGVRSLHSRPTPVGRGGRFRRASPRGSGRSCPSPPECSLAVDDGGSSNEPTRRR